jgi:uncharacterized protein YbjT (DUF2867 family)
MIASLRAAGYFRDMSCRRVTVFGGTGFLGRRIVRHLQDADFAVRIASRHPDRGRSLFSRDVSGIEPFRADVNDDGSVASAVAVRFHAGKAVKDALNPPTAKAALRKKSAPPPKKSAART